jgi:hypothetical protein
MYFVNDQMVGGAPISNSVRFVFHIRCVSVVRSLSVKNFFGVFHDRLSVVYCFCLEGAMEMVKFFPLYFFGMYFVDHWCLRKESELRCISARGSQDKNFKRNVKSAMTSFMLKMKVLFRCKTNGPV